MALSEFEQEVAALRDRFSDLPMTGDIQAAYEKGVAALAGHGSVETLARGSSGEGGGRGHAALFATDAASLLAGGALGQEVFGLPRYSAVVTKPSCATCSPGSKAN